MTTMLLDTLVSSDELLAKRADVVRRLVSLRALYGGNGYMGERLFKVEEAKVATAVRAQLEADGEKVTEPKVDAMTRQHENYVAALAFDVEQRSKWIALEEELNEIEWRLRCRQTDGALLSAEARLTQAAQ
jgi:hypothetical protein